MRKILVIPFLILFFSISWVSVEAQPTEIPRDTKVLAEKVDQLMKAGKYEETIPYARKFLEIVEKKYGEDNPKLSDLLDLFGGLHKKAGHISEAELLMKRSLEITEKALGKEHPDVAGRLNNLGALYYDTRRYAEAEPIYKRSLEVREKMLPEDNPDVAQSLHNLALLYQTIERYAEAEPLYTRSLGIREKVLGREHPDVAATLNNLALLYGATGRNIEAESLHKRALEIREKVLGKEHPDVAWSLNNLALLYGVTGRYAEAEPLYRRSLEIREKALGKDHLDVALTLDALALLCGVTGQYAEAEPMYKRSLEIKEKVLGKEHLGVAWSLNNLGAFYYDTRRYAEAEPLHRRALEIREKILGKEHPDVASSLNNLAMVYKVTGRYTEAESLYKRSLKIREKTLGNDHPDVAESLHNLALAYENTGRYVEAETLYKRSLEIRERIFGKDHPEVAASLNNLALIYQSTARYAEAERLHRRSLDIRVKVLGQDNPDVAASLNNLALIYKDTGRYAEAESLYKRSLEIRERIFGKDHIDVAQSLYNLGWICAKTGRLLEAESLFTRTLTIREKELGKDNISIAESLNDLAVIYWRTGRYLKAESFLKRSIEIMEKKLDKEPLNPMVFINMAVVLGEINKPEESHRMLIRGLGAEEIHRETTFAMLSERQKLNYMEQRKWMIHGLLTHTLRTMQRDNRAVRETFEVWLKWKGAAMEAQGRYIEAVTYSDDPDIKNKFEDLTFVREAIARLQISGPGKMNIQENREGYRKRLEELEKKKESLEGELNRLSNAFALEKIIGKANTKTISRVLLGKNKDSIYIDFAQINLYDFERKRFVEPKYIVFALIPSDEPVVKLLDLSDAGKVNSHIQAYLEEMRRAREYGEPPRDRILKGEGRAVYEMLVKPLEQYIKGKKHLYISPDGNLNLIPFEVLINQDGKYLIEDYLITYVTAGRDIVRFTDKAVAKGELLIMADPDYDMGLEEKTRVAKLLGLIETRSPSPLSKDAKDLRFKRLPETKKEADAIERVLNESNKTHVRNLQDQRALEEVLLAVREPKLLHLATHGYFLKDEEVKRQQVIGSLLLEREVMADLVMENLMLRSGIVLAGANSSLREGRDDGVVSAEKILGLRLKGTELVVLSACETGTGDVKNGEGVFGLKRAFILSGAKTVVMSLWSIPSKETTELMIDFYTLMAKGKTKAEALREARLNLMKEKSNPFYWGGFIMVGNPN